MEETIVGHSGKVVRKKTSIVGKIVLFSAIIIVGSLAYFTLIKINPKADDSAQRQAGKVAAVPERDADIYGMVTSVKGNQITILKFDVSTMPGTKQGSSAKTATSGNAISLGQTSTGMGGGMGGPPGASARSGSYSKSSSGSGSSSSTRQTMMAELKKSSIGSETITVPVGIPISKADATTADAQLQNVALNKLTADSTVAIWLGGGSGGMTTAEYINIIGKVDMGNSNN